MEVLLERRFFAAHIQVGHVNSPRPCWVYVGGVSRCLHAAYFFTEKKPMSLCFEKSRTFECALGRVHRVKTGSDPKILLKDSKVPTEHTMSADTVPCGFLQSDMQSNGKLSSAATLITPGFLGFSLDGVAWNP